MISRGWYSFNSSLSIFDDSDRSVSDLSGVFLCVAPRAYSFNPERFKFCNSIGALDNFNNATTGRCNSRANNYDRECD